MKKHSIEVFLLMFIIAFGALFLYPALEMILWNWVVVDVFGGPVVTYWQMFALNWLCSMLFKKVTKGDDF